MYLLFAAVLQTVSAGSPERIDLTIPLPCEVSRADDQVVVCGNRNGESPYRLKQPAQKPRKALPDAQLQIGEGVAIAAETEQADVGGFTSNRAMVRLKIKF
jgi:hypothetical protein